MNRILLRCKNLKWVFFIYYNHFLLVFLKDKTLHNHWDYAGFTVPYYNIPSNNRELQQRYRKQEWNSNYNIPSNNRELQHFRSMITGYSNYNIPSNNRELQPILLFPIQPFDYNIPSNNRELQPDPRSNSSAFIITYQVITGNYSCLAVHLTLTSIITYQVITGNYSTLLIFLHKLLL